MDGFQCFYKETLEFLLGIRLNNHKDFFEQHRLEYNQYVRQPMIQLAEQLNPLIGQIDPELDTRPDRVVARIRRDTRFSRDKTPYRDHLWLAYRPVGKELGLSFAFYFELTLDHYSFGVGHYQASREEMQAFRARLLVESDTLNQIDKQLEKDGFTLYGEEYKRPLPNMPPPPLARWYQKKGFYLAQNHPVGPAVFSKEIYQQVYEGFSALQPIYQFVKGK